MKKDTHKIFSLAAVVVAAILFGMVLSGGLDLTQRVSADRPEPTPAPAFNGIVLPDFVANAGGVICAAVEYHQGSEAQAMSTVEQKIRANVQEVLDRTTQTGALPRAVALDIARERVQRAMAYRRTF